VGGWKSSQANNRKFATLAFIYVIGVFFALFQFSIFASVLSTAAPNKLSANYPPTAQPPFGPQQIELTFCGVQYAKTGGEELYRRGQKWVFQINK